MSGTKIGCAADYIHRTCPSLENLRNDIHTCKKGSFWRGIQFTEGAYVIRPETQYPARISLNTCAVAPASSFLDTRITHRMRACFLCCFGSWAEQLQNLLDLAVAAVMWWAFGWGIAFGAEDDSGFNQFVGPGTFFTRGDEFRDEEGHYDTTEGYSWALWLFQVCSRQIVTSSPTAACSP